MKKNIEDIYPLSPMQQGMLFHTLYTPASQVYITQVSCLLEGEISVPDFEQAWQQVVQRNPILRTAFVWERIAEPRQVVFREVELIWIHEDWQGYSPDEQQEKLEAFMVANQERGFDLSRPPLIRPSLIKLAPNRYYLVLCHHHLLMDGWSLPLILTEGFSCYFAYCQGKVPELPSRRPYGEYIDWLRKRDLRDAEAFWRKYLAGFTAPTPLGLESTPRMPANELAESYGDITITLPAEISKGLQECAREYKLTFGVLIQAAWALLLHFYSGEQDVLFGLATAGRSADLPDITSMIGLFVNTLPVRVRIEPDMPLITWICELHRNLARLLEYEYSPLVQVLGWSEVARGTPLFESLLIFDNYPMESFIPDNGTNFRVQFLQSVEHTNFPLSLRARPGAQGEVSLSLSYAKSRFQAEVVERIFEHLLTVFAAFLAQPEQRLKDISILGREESTRLLTEWNATEAQYSSDQSLCHLFERQVRQTPDALAVIYADSQLTYRQLNAQANQLARLLIARGVGPDVVVGVLLERSLLLPVALLAILKAGGSYLPLDPGYPAQRLRFMLADSAAVLLLSDMRLGAAWEASAVPVLLLDDPATMEHVQQQSSQSPGQRSEGAHLAYVLYTSGSTGQPKGVMIPQQALVNHMRWMLQTFDWSAQDRFVQKTPISFDASVWEFFAPWLLGATLVVARPGVQQESAALVKLLIEERISVLQVVPTLLRMLLQEPDLEQCQQLRHLFCGGEALTGELSRHLLACLPGVQVHNLYGPTEVTIDALWETVQGSTEGRNVPIGRPIANTRAYVLDRWQRLVPLGVPGELYLAGMGLARGYVGQAERTAERFVPDPYSQEPGGRMYQTGDRVRVRPDGRLEYLGRLDQQVKLRGLRIELGEIESALTEHAQVKQNVVCLREETSGEKRLVAYIKSVEAAPPSVSELRDYLKGRLPAYMVPALYVFLQDFPLTPNGKIDYRALPAPDNQRPVLLAEFANARTPEEQVLTQIWRELLGLEQVGIHDNFFDLGGHSLLMMQLYTRVREHFTRELLMVDIFQYPTIASLAEYLASKEKEDKEIKATLEQADSRANLRSQLRLRQEQLRQKQRSAY